MKIIQCLKVARDLELPRQFAVNARQRFITARLMQIDAQLDGLMPWLEYGGVNAAFVAPDICDLSIEKCRLIQETQYMKTGMDKTLDISDAMIEAARKHPISNLVEFRRGKAKAWCHDDHNPSLYHGTRSNRAVCPVCDKKFDPIAVLMTRDGMMFKDAVKRLSD